MHKQKIPDCIFRKKSIIDIDSHITSGTGSSKIMQPFKIMSRPNNYEKLIQLQVNLF